MLVAQKSQLESKAKQLMAQIEKNKAMMAQAMVEETYTQIISPLNGVVVAKNVEVGDMATPGSPLLIVENTDNLYLELNVEEANAFMFKPGSQIELTIDAYPNSSVVGVVREVIPSADEDTHTFKVKIDIPPHELLHAGMYARAIMPISGTNIFIPRTALINKGQITGVYVVDNNNIARFRIIKPGQEIQGFVEVISGLTEKDKVSVRR
jgi:RND family efflux transporter MFP subunit